MLFDLVFTFMVTLAGWVAFSVLNRTIQLTKKERGWVTVGFAYHVAAAWAQMFLLYSLYKGGDMSYYYWKGGILAEWATRKPEMLWELMRLALGLRADLPIGVMGNGSPTGAMSGVASLALVLTQGAPYAANTLMSLLAFSGLVALYWAFKQISGPNLYALFALVFMPSVTFWVSGMQKESLAVTGMGYAVAGLAAILFRRRYKSGVLLASFGIFIVYLFKPYILVALITAASALFVQRIKGSTLKKGFIAFAMAAAALLAITNIMPEYSPSEVAEQTGALQIAHSQIGGGSHVEYSASGNKSISGQLRNVPVATVSSFFRPFFFEIHNITSALSALETTGLTMMFIVVFVRRPLRRSIQIVLSNPILLFCLVFLLIFGVAVGLAAPNLGTLSRYRVPMMPMYGFLVMSLAFGTFRRGGSQPKPQRVPNRANPPGVSSAFVHRELQTP